MNESGIGDDKIWLRGDDRHYMHLAWPSRCRGPSLEALTGSILAWDNLSFQKDLLGFWRALEERILSSRSLRRVFEERILSSKSLRRVFEERILSSKSLRRIFEERILRHFNNDLSRCNSEAIQFVSFPSEKSLLSHRWKWKRWKPIGCRLTRTSRIKSHINSV